MKNKMDALLREKINNLDTVPPGLTRDNEAGWEKIKKNQKAIAGKTDFVKKAAWGIILAAVLTEAFLFYGFEKPEEVKKEERGTYSSPATEKTEMQLEQTTAVYAKPDSKERKTTQEKTVTPRPVQSDTSMKIIVPTATVKPSADKQKEANTIKVPKAPARYPSLIGNAWEEGFRPAMAPQGKNLVQNGTFEEGNVGFKSDFRFLPHEDFVVGYTQIVSVSTQINGSQQVIAIPQISPIIAGSYIITDGFSHQKNRQFYSTTIYHDSSGFLSPSDSLGSSIPIVQTAVNPVPSMGSFLAVNINISGKQRIWYNSISVKPNTTYSFSCILANVSTQSSNPGAFKLCVNGEKVSKTLDLPLTNEWRSLSGMFTSGRYQTTIEISIEDIQSPIFNNLVALDNIIFKEIPPGEFRKKKERFSK